MIISNVNNRYWYTVRKDKRTVRAVSIKISYRHSILEHAVKQVSRVSQGIDELVSGMLS